MELCDGECEECVCPLVHYVPFGDILAVRGVIENGMAVMMDKDPKEIHYMVNTALGGSEISAVMMSEDE